jgi:replication factor C subunit 1
MSESNLWTDKYKPSKIEDLVGNKKAIEQIILWLDTFEKNSSIVRKNIDDKKNKSKSKKKESKNKELKNKESNKISETEETETLDEEIYISDVEDDSKKSKTTTPLAQSSIIVTGGHGIGKSVAIEVITREKGYEPKQIAFSTLKKIEDIDGYLSSLNHASSVIELIKNKSNTEIKKNILIIDEIESITSNNDKKIITMIQKSNELKWFFPIIFISNSKHNRFLHEVKKNSDEIRFYNPLRSELEIIISKICKNENIKFTSIEVIDKILIHTQLDIRRLVYTLQEIKCQFYDQEKITVEDIDNYLEFSSSKDIDEHLFDATKNLLSEYISVSDALRSYEVETSTSPLMVHYNVPRFIIRNLISKKQRLDIADKIVEHFSFGDVIENYIFENQEWDIRDVHGFITCVYPSYLLHTEIPQPSKEIKLEYTTDPNRVSIRQINKKNIDNAKKCFQQLGVYDFLYVGKILNKILKKDLKDTESIDKMTELFNGYHIKLDHLESLLKIDKIITNEDENNMNIKNILTSKQKNKIKSLLEE